jgi:DNA-binding NarL/FixJ family response regulator
MSSDLSRRRLLATGAGVALGGAAAASLFGVREETRSLDELYAAAVVLMDLRLADGDVDGIETTRRILTALPGTRVVVLTSYGRQADVLRAVEAGARGYVLKAGPPDELFRAVRAAASGGMGLAPEAAARVVGHAVGPGPVLSDRETEVVRLLAGGHSNRDIANALFLAEATVKTHPVRIYRKLGTENRAGTVSEAVRLGIVEPDAGVRRAAR